MTSARDALITELHGEKGEGCDAHGGPFLRRALYFEKDKDIVQTEVDQMRAVTKIFLYEDDVKFFGEGPYKLLQCIGETHSLNAAASKMYMSYSKAFAMVKRAEEALGFPLTEKRIIQTLRL